jgi:hypothetical protein
MQLRFPDETERGAQSAAKAPLSGYMRAFMAELVELRSNMPQHVRCNCKFLQTLKFNNI